MDLSPNYAGTLMGITNTMANIAGFVAPYVVGSIIEGNVSSNDTSYRRVKSGWHPLGTYPAPEIEYFG